MQTRMEEDSSNQTELYTLLGVQRTATAEEIKKAFRLKALRWHPDKVDEAKREEAGEMFKNIKKAYDVLSDETNRKMYDKYGPASLEPFFEPPVVAPEPMFSFPMPPPTPHPQPAPQPSVFHEPPEPRPPFLHRSSSFDPFFRPFPQPVPDIFDPFFAFPPQAYAFTYSSHPASGPVPTPNYFPEYLHPFGFPMFASPVFAPPEPQPVPPMPAASPPSMFFYVASSMTSQPMAYSSPASTPPNVETFPDDEYLPSQNQRQEQPRRWGPMQPQPPEPKLPKTQRKGRTFVNKLRRRESTPTFQPRRAWDEQDARRRRGNVSPSRGQRMKDMFNIFTKRQ